MADPMRTIEYVLIALMAYQFVRLWWRLNRRWVKKWWQRVKDHHPRQRHPKTPKELWGLKSRSVADSSVKRLFGSHGVGPQALGIL